MGRPRVGTQVGNRSSDTGVTHWECRRTWLRHFLDISFQIQVWLISRVAFLSCMCFRADRSFSKMQVIVQMLVLCAQVGGCRCSCTSPSDVNHRVHISCTDAFVPTQSKVSLILLLRTATSSR